ncbi:MAG TPA: LytTR family DNA-binding domain-containing protein [Puia sp.]|nr:LytTR family DNA-binding domain-containing protein [Puia sp.]
MSEHLTIRTRCLIVDDEPPAREVIKRYIEQVPILELTGECANAIQALIVLRQQPVDLIFLDIRMPQLNGTDFLKTLKDPPRIIFTTAYAEYAVEGYELDVVDFLMKPVRFDRFLKAVNKAFPSQGSKSSAHANLSAIPGGAASAAQAATYAPVQDRKNDSFVYFRADRKMVKVLLNEILYIESMKDYVKVITADATIITKQSISSVEAMLPEKLFVRTHRSFIVSLGNIRSFTNELIEVGKTQIPVGKLYRNAVLKMLE